MQPLIHRIVTALDAAITRVGTLPLRYQEGTVRQSTPTVDPAAADSSRRARLSPRQLAQDPGTTHTEHKVIALTDVPLESVSKRLRKTLELIQGYMVMGAADQGERRVKDGPVP